MTSPATASPISLSSPGRELTSSQSGSDFDNYYTTLLVRIESLEKDKSVLELQLDSLSLQQQNQDKLENKVTSLSQENASLTSELQTQQKANNNVVHAIQQQMDELTLANRKLEDMMVVLNSAGNSPDNFDQTESRMMLEKIQTRYSDEVSNLMYDLREKEKALQETRTKKASMVRYFLTRPFACEVKCINLIPNHCFICRRKKWSPFGRNHRSWNKFQGYFLNTVNRSSHWKEI